MAEQDGDRPGRGRHDRGDDRGASRGRSGGAPRARRDGAANGGRARDGQRSSRDGDRPRSSWQRDDRRPQRDGDRPRYTRDGEKPRSYGDRDGRGARDAGRRPERDADRPRSGRSDREGDRSRSFRDRDGRPKRDGERARPGRDGDKPRSFGDRGGRPSRDGDRPRAFRDGDRRQRDGARPGGDRRFDDRRERTNSRPPEASRVRDPELPDDITPRDLPGAARNELKTLSKENAERVARHLAMAARTLDEDPQLAHEHAQAAVRHAGRVAVARETLAITAYTVGDFALALRELRTYRRITGRDDMIALIVDSERGLGRPERALEEGRAVDRDSLPAAVRVELAIAMSGARLDLGETQLALVELDIPELDPNRAFEWSPGLFAARANVLEDLGLHDEAAEWRRRAEIAADALGHSPDEDEFDVIEIDDADTEELPAEPVAEPEGQEPGAAAPSAGEQGAPEPERFTVEDEVAEILAEVDAVAPEPDQAPEETPATPDADKDAAAVNDDENGEERPDGALF